MNLSKTQHKQASTRLSVARVRRHRGGEKREAGVRADNHDRRARSELAGSPTWNQRHGCADLPSSKTLAAINVHENALTVQETLLGGFISPPSSLISSAQS